MVAIIYTCPNPDAGLANLYQVKEAQELCTRFCAEFCCGLVLKIFIPILQGYFTDHMIHMIATVSELILKNTGNDSRKSTTYS